MPKTSFQKFKRLHHFLFFVPILCIGHGTLEASEILTQEDCQIDRLRFARTRNTQSRMSTMLDVQNVSSQQAYDLKSKLKRLHQKVLQSIGAKLDIHFQAQQALKQFQTLSVNLSQNVAILSIKNFIDHLLPPEMLINTTLISLDLRNNDINDVGRAALYQNTRLIISGISE